jgi:23S rRNA (adenine2503-C2)-methyltransferase
LDSLYEIPHLTMLKKQVSALDGTVKFLWQLADGESVETVLMRYKHGNTVCISSQVGCRMGCAFCASTIGGKVRDLRASEILDEVIRTGLEAEAEISNIVLMGIGEPLDNFDNVIRFLRLVNHPEGANIGMRHISLSTCGVVPGIDKLAELNLQLTLSVSLHAPDDETRSQLMPVNRAYGVEELYKACERYFKKTGRRISFEYAMVRDVNDTPYHAQLLAKRVRSMGAHVNLIRLNYVSERGLQPSTEERVKEFSKSLSDSGVTVTVRRRLGSDIDAACGQLRRGQMRKP